MTRTEKIDAAVSDAGQLISALLEMGPLTPAQCSVLVMAAARAVVPNFEEWEARDSAIRIVKELEDEDKSRNGG
jgi:hypothetical protein